MMKILVTGASGFIGGYLIQDLLHHRYKIRALTRNPDLKIKGIEIVVGDITQPQTLNNAADGVEAVFHNAAYAIDWGKKEDFYRVNQQGTRHVAETCEKNGVKKLIYTSSAGIYGFPNRTNEITEQTPPHPLNAYQRSKFKGEKELQKFKNLQISIVRPPLVLGAGSNAVRLLLSNIKQKKLWVISHLTRLN